MILKIKLFRFQTAEGNHQLRYLNFRSELFLIMLILWKGCCKEELRSSSLFDLFVSPFLFLFNRCSRFIIELFCPRFVIEINKKREVV